LNSHPTYVRPARDPQHRHGAAYEDTVAHFSESEREVTGLVFALAGYLVHAVYETVMLLDSLAAVDANRITVLVEYVTKHIDYLVVAFLSVDVAVLD
jgi:hypothetical protein